MHTLTMRIMPLGRTVKEVMVLPELGEQKTSGVTVRPKLTNHLLRSFILSINNLPAIVRSTTSMAKTRSALPAVAQSQRQVLSSAPIVGYSAAGKSTITKQSLAKVIKDVKPGTPFFNKKVVLGGSAIAVSTIAGMGIEDVLDLLSLASPSELQDAISAADEHGAIEVADAFAEVYNNVSIVERASLQPSQADRDMAVVDGIERPGLGLNAAAIDHQQVILRAYKSIRGSLNYEDLWTLRVLITTASDEDLMALEDLYRG